MTENLAQNATLTEAIDKLMESPAHRGNILDPELTDFGVGIAIKKDESGAPLFIVTQNFGKRITVIDEKSFLKAIQARVGEVANGAAENGAMSSLARAHSQQMKSENRTNVNLAYGNLFTIIKGKVSGLSSLWGQVFRLKDLSFLKEFSPPVKNWRQYGVGLEPGAAPGEFFITIVFAE